MLSTYLSKDAVRRLNHGVPYALREEIVRMDGTPEEGQPVRLVDEEDGRVLGVGDLDLGSSHAVRRLSLPDEPAQGVIPRHLRQAIERRATFVQDPRYCRMVHDDGDGLPGLVIDRFDEIFVVQTFTRAMDARLDEIVRGLVEVAGAEAVLLRNDGRRRRAMGLQSSSPRELFGKPPRWTRVLELGARLTVDIQYGAGTGYFYDQRQLRRVIGRISERARVLDLCCFVGGQFVHAGLHGARQVLAFDTDADALELARENAEANGLLGRATFERSSPLAALEGLDDPFDLVVLACPALSSRASPGGEDELGRLLSLSVRHTRRGGHLLVSGYHPPLPAGSAELDGRLALACEREGRVGFRIARPGLPFDFPTVIGAPETEYMSAVAIELS